MKRGLLIIFSALFFVTCKPKSEGVKNISIKDLEILLKKDIQLVDVRTPEEWKKGIIKNALKIDITSDNFEVNALKQLDKSKPVYLYCRSGIRSLIAGEMLYKHGFTVYNFEDGYNEWKNKIEE